MKAEFDEPLSLYVMICVGKNRCVLFPALWLCDGTLFGVKSFCFVSGWPKAEFDEP